MVDFTSVGRWWENAQCAALLAGKLSGQASEHWAQLWWCFGRGKKEEGKERGAEGLLPCLTCSTWQLAGVGCHPSAWFLPEVSKSLCHEQLMEFAFQVGKPGINKSNAKGR